MISAKPARPAAPVPDGGRPELLRDNAAERTYAHPLFPAAAGADAHAPPLRPRAEGGPAPLSLAQALVWEAHRADPASALHTLAAAVRMRGALDVDALRGALRALVERHAALRTAFRDDAAGPVQVVHPAPAEIALPLFDVRAFPRAWAEGEVRRLAADEAEAPFDPGRAPALRALLVRLADDEHVLVLATHRGAADEASLRTLFHELSALYAAHREGLLVAFRPTPLDFSDVAAWQRARDEALRGHAAFWRRVLEGAPAALELPADHPRPAHPLHRARTRALEVPAATAARLVELARAEDAPLTAVLLAAFAALLHRLAESAEVVVGSPASGRFHRETAAMVGPFARTLPVRAGLRGDPDFRALVRQVHRAALEASAHQELPVDPEPQAALSLEGPAPAAELPGLRWTLEEVDGGIARHDLHLRARDDGERLRVSLDYAADLWEPASAERMALHFVRLLEAVAAEPDRPLSRAELMDAAERRRVLELWNRTATAYPRDASLPALFAEQARARPHAPALVFGAERVTYAELDARANRLARYLHAVGVRPGNRVGLALDRSADLVVATLATLKAGASYVPLDLAYPADRLAFMRRDSRVVAVVAATAAAAGVGANEAVRVVGLAEERAAIGAMPDTDPGAPVFAESEAYVVYTSGSTGTPKASAIPHRGLARLVKETDYLRLGPSDRVSHLSNTSFDAAAFEVWGALLNGATLVVIGRETALEPARLSAALREEGVTTVFLTTALFNAVAREAPGAFAGVANVLFGGEAADPASLRRVLAAAPPGRLLNLYGPSENSTFATWHPVAEVPAGAATVPIGRPVSNTTVFALDAALRPVPIGTPGELYVGGDGVAHGYVGLPGLTAERFVPDPFSRRPGGRLYRTGDHVRWTERGELEFLGRLDGQVKVRGFRIELGEVESVLARHPGVAAAVAHLYEYAPGDRRVVAYAIPRHSGDAAPLSGAGVRAWLRDRLPDYMVPASVVLLPTFPLTPNGKVDRCALPAPVFTREAGGVEPRTETEILLAALWAEVLRLERVYVDDDFFELGGQSLLAMQLAARLREAFQVELPLERVFEARTVARLAQEVDAERDAALRAALDELDGLSDDEVRALLEAEEGAFQGSP